jgi:hypothetical protein
LKAHVAPNVFFGEVGDGNSDHACWMRPEDMTTPRGAYQINASHPGSDLAGETAAALAAASMVFQTINASYSATLLTNAQQVQYTISNTTFFELIGSRLSTIEGLINMQSWISHS